MLINNRFNVQRLLNQARSSDNAKALQKACFRLCRFVLAKPSNLTITARCRFQKPFGEAYKQDNPAAVMAAYDPGRCIVVQAPALPHLRVLAAAPLPFSK